MGKTLVLAEKPSVGRELARVLGCKASGDGCLYGGSYIVTWAMGHLVTLADPEAYDKKYQTWRLEDLPMLPERLKTVVIGQTTRQFKAVSALMKRPDVDSLVIATDAGREGELVARWIMEKAGFKKPAKRLWISSQTDKAIKEGFTKLRPASEYDSLFKSARARSEADWLVGLNVTRALTCKFGAQLSAGRVQTPTLSLIVSREEEITRFQPKDYYTVQIKTPQFTALWRDKSGNGRLFDREKAEAVAGAVKNGQAALTSATRESKFTPPPAAYDLTELQRDANRRFAYSAKETLNIMQRLYENYKVLTYPRTDSRYITPDVAATIPDRLRAVATGPYQDAARALLKERTDKYIVNAAKVTDHHAIIPTEETPDLWAMTGPERNIYDLVVKRFLAVLSKPARYEDARFKLSAGGHAFHAKGRIVLEAGWKAVYGADTGDDDDDDGDDRAQSLPALTQGQKLNITGVEIKSGKTSPPPRYTEATLLTAMEHPTGHDSQLQKVLEQTSGLGTPATRADIIEKLFDTFYIERRGKELIPTSKGRQLIGLVPEELRSAELTARWEQQLSRISKSEASDAAFIKDIRGFAEQLVRDVRTSQASYTHDNVTRSKCPDCGKFLLDVNGKRGKMLVCPDRDCGYRRTVSAVTNARCPNCHKKMELRGEGEKRMFACVCGFREKLSDFEKRKAERGAGKADVNQYLRQQEAQPEKGNTAMADQLAKWLEKNQ